MDSRLVSVNFCRGLAGPGDHWACPLPLRFYFSFYKHYLAFEYIFPSWKDVYIVRATIGFNLFKRIFGCSYTSNKISELVSKYGVHANRISKGFEGVFKLLPLVTVIDNSVLVCHGGISDITDLQYINTIPRHKVCYKIRY